VPIEEQDLQGFIFAQPVRLAQITHHRLRVVEHRRFRQPFLFHPLGQRESGHERYCFVPANARLLPQIVYARHRQRMQRAVFVQQILSHLNDISALQTRAQLAINSAWLKASGLLAASRSRGRSLAG